MILNHLNPTDISYLSNILTLPHTNAVAHSMLKDIPQNDLSLWCLNNAYYQLPSVELIDFLKSEIAGKTAIEIGAGNGCIGRNLGITITDNCLQNRPDIHLYYKSLGQNTITYPTDIVKMKAEDAIRKYNPEVVVGCWITEKVKGGVTIGAIEGPDEDFIMSHPSVKKYIMVGNWRTHSNKALLSRHNYRIVKADWLYSRSLYKSDNCILIFEK